MVKLAEAIIESDSFSRVRATEDRPQRADFTRPYLRMRGFSALGPILLLAVVLLFSPSAHAADIYFAQSSAGSNNGTSCANARAVGTWSSSDFTAGNTIHLCGKITSELQAQGSGTSGSRITVVFETGASIQVPYCDNSTGCFNFGGNNYITLDGGVGQPCGWNTATNTSEGTCNGFIEATANGSSLANQQGGNGVTINGTGDIVQNLGIYNLYVYSNNSGTFANANVAWVICTTSAGCTVQHCKMHDAEWGGPLWEIGSSVSGPFVVASNEIYHFSHGPTLPYSGNGGTVSGILIHGNYIHDFDFDSAGCGFHNDSIHIYGQSPPVTVSYDIYDNIFGGAAGACLTAHIFQESTTIAGTDRIYNNLMYFTDSPNGGTGIIGLGPTSGGSLALYNNTIVCSSADGGPIGSLLNVSGFTFENNLLKNCSPVIWWEGGTLTSNFNAWDIATCSSGGNQCFKSTSGATYPTLVAWQSATSKDANSVSGATNLSSSFTLQSGSSAIGKGTNLSSLGITALNSDLAGVGRPASGAWDVGAYAAGGGSAGQVAPPTNVVATVN